METATGGVVWLLLRKGSSTWPELIGVGFALGTLLSTLSSQMTRTTPWSGIGWLFPTAVVGIGLVACVSTGRRHRQPKILEVPDGLTLLTASAIAITSQFWWFLRNQLGVTGWHTLFVDVPFLESIANSLQWFGAGDSTVMAGQPVRYHWLAYAWIGSTNAASGAEPFVVSTRLLPISAGIAIIMLVWTLTRLLTSGWFAGFLAALLAVFGASTVDAWQHRLITPYSPSLMMSGVWLLTAFVVILLQLEESSMWTVPLMGLLAFACSAGKISAGLLLIVGLAIAVGGMWRSPWRRILIVDLVVASIVFSGTYWLLFAGESEGGAELVVGSLAAYYGLTPIRGNSLGMTIGVFAVSLAILAPWAGLLTAWTWRRLSKLPAVWLASGSALVSLVIVNIVQFGMNDQQQFATSAAAFAIPVSAAGVATGVQLLAVPRRRLTGLGLMGAVVGLAILLSLRILDAEYRYVVLLTVALLVLVVAALTVRWDRNCRDAPRLFMWTISWLLVAASVTFGMGTSALFVARAYRHPEKATSETPFAWNSDHIQAAEWVTTHVPRDAIMATDRWCSQRLSDNSDCQPSWWLTSALTGRRMLAEGYTSWLGVGSTSDETRDRWNTVRDFTMSPSASSASTLRDTGAEWVWVEDAPPSTVWEPWATVVYKNPTVTVLHLN